MRKNSVGSRNAKTGKVTVARVAKLSGYSTASVILKRKQGMTDEEIVTQGLERQEQQAKERGYRPETKVFEPLKFPKRVEPTQSREAQTSPSSLLSNLPPPPTPPPPPSFMDSGESLDPVDTPAETYSQAALREKIAMANKREMEELVMRGMLVHAEEVATLWARIGGQIRDELLAIPDRISIRLDQRPYREIREILMMEIRRVLLGISEDTGKQAEMGEAGEAGEGPIINVEPTESSAHPSQASL